MSARRTRTAVTSTLLAVPLALALVACGSDDPESASSPAAPVGSTSESAPSTPAGSEQSGPSTPSEPAPASGGDAALIAAQTGLDAVAGSTVFSVDRDGGGWEVQVVAQDGTESELSVSEDGATVTREPVVDTDDSDEGDDLAERQRLLQEATVAYGAAFDTAVGQVPGGTVTGFDLDEDDGVATWDVQLDEDTADEQTVTIDAVTGDVLRVEQDD